MCLLPSWCSWRPCSTSSATLSGTTGQWSGSWMPSLSWPRERGKGSLRKHSPEPSGQSKCQPPANFNMWRTFMCKNKLQIWSVNLVDHPGLSDRLENMHGLASGQLLFWVCSCILACETDLYTFLCSLHCFFCFFLANCMFRIVPSKCSSPCKYSPFLILFLIVVGGVKSLNTSLSTSDDGYMYM